MKLKIFTIVLSVLVLSLTIVSCVSLPLENVSRDESKASPQSEAAQSEAGKASSVEQTESSGEEPTEEESSAPEPVSQSHAEESSQPPVEESSVPPQEESSEAPAEVSKTEEPSTEIDPPDNSKEETSRPKDNTGNEVLIPDVEGIPYKSYKGLTKSSIKASEYDEYYNDSMFIGLSILVHFQNYVNSMRSKYPAFLGNSIIFARSNFSAYNNFRYKPSDEDSVHPTYKGEKMTCEDAVKASGVKTVYLSIMALNELGIYSSNCVERTYETTIRLINAIKEKSPSVNIVILSNTYMVYDFNNYKNLNNANISALNNKVLDYCNANGMDFIDVSTMLMDGNVLSDDLCRDAHEGSGCHLNNDGFAIWTAVLRNYAFLKQKGLYKNPTSMPTYTKNK